MGQAIARLVLDWEGQRIPLAASVGLASFTGQEQATALLAEADAEMYRDKRAVKGAALESVSNLMRNVRRDGAGW
jgi:GGDEF domain-containing protein